MVNIGKINHLQIIKAVSFGLYLDGGGIEILLPKRYVPEKYELFDYLDVFVYVDSEDRLVAVTDTPYAKVDECAYLKVVDSNHVGAFMDWGLIKDLLVPHNEQVIPLAVGKSYVVYVYLDDETERLAASTKLRNFISETSVYHQEGQQVDLLIQAETEMGYKAIVDNTHIGLIYHNEVFQELSIGQRVQGYIKLIREDHKIDLCLQRPARQERDALMERILQDLKQRGGTSDLTDRSPPDSIYRQFSVSKKNYKKALGRLYKQRLIKIEPKKITLISAI
jgi:predicted RNA-binding protein (virulence factor B family)